MELLPFLPVVRIFFIRLADIDAVHYRPLLEQKPDRRQTYARGTSYTGRKRSATAHYGSVGERHIPELVEFWRMEDHNVEDQPTDR